MPTFRTIATPANSRELNKVITGLAQRQSSVFSTLINSLKIGMSTIDIADVVRSEARRQQVDLCFRERFNFSDDISICLNDEVMNGVPRQERMVRRGDTLKISFGVHDGMKAFATQTWTVYLGEVTARHAGFLEDTQRCLDATISCCVAGATISDVARCMRKQVSEKGHFLSRDFSGHLIGAEPVLKPMIVEQTGALAPQYALSRGAILSLLILTHPAKPRLGQRDGCGTVYDKNRELSACFSHLVEVTDDKPRILSSSHPFMLPLN